MKKSSCLFLLFFFLLGCSPEASEPPYVPQQLDAYWPTAGWRTADPRDVGFDIARIREIITDIEEADIGVDSLAIVRHGYLVVDEYFNDFALGQRHIIYSCTKSVVSTLIGIAIADDHISSIDQKMLDLFPTHDPQNLDENKQAITLENMLSMQAGFNARDSYLYDWVGLEAMHDSQNPVQYVLDLPMAEAPGTRFEYTNGVSHLLSALITETTGQSALQYARQKLFAPLGITNVEWTADAQSVNWGYSHLYMTAHDMAKFGYLFLNNGSWDQTQVLPESWVIAASTQKAIGTMVDGYGYQWWIDNSGYYLALGYKGQFIFVSPQHDVVAVFTSSQPSAFNFSLPLFESRILPAISD